MYWRCQMQVLKGQLLDPYYVLSVVDTMDPTHISSNSVPPPCLLGISWYPLCRKGEGAVKGTCCVCTSPFGRVCSRHASIPSLPRTFSSVVSVICSCTYSHIEHHHVASIMGIIHVYTEISDCVCVERMGLAGALSQALHTTDWSHGSCPFSLSEVKSAILNLKFSRDPVLFT